MRKSNAFFLSLAVSGILFLFTVTDASLARRSALKEISKRSQLVAELGLTDLALFTEARYTRHLSQSDLHSAFQEHPMAIEHFPSGSLVLPPRASK